MYLTNNCPTNLYFKKKDQTTLRTTNVSGNILRKYLGVFIKYVLVLNQQKAGKILEQDPSL